MKKFFISILIILALGGAAFYFGWATFAVSPGTYGIISSKTHGIDPEPVQAGVFRWVWYRLIPTNVKISVYRLDHKQFQIDYTSSLPSGDIYAQFVGLESPNFSWDLKGHISFSLNPDYLINIVTQNNFTEQEELDNYMNDTAEKIKMVILHYLSEAKPEELETILSGSANSAFNREILGKYPEIRDFSFAINTAKYPDFSLYREIRAIYEEFLAKQREYITSSFGQRAEGHIQSRLHFAELEKYGELLTKYPILLDYLINTEKQ